MPQVRSASEPSRRGSSPRRGGLLFFGIYQLGVEALTALVAAGYDIAAVVTKPSRAGKVQPLAVLAREYNLPLFNPPTIAAPETIAELSSLKPRLITVAGYNQKIPQVLLELPPLGAINLHGSLLPRYRGPTPWKWAILHGEQETGVTVHVMTARIDEGDILGQVLVSITDDDTGESLFRKIAAAGGPLLANVVGQVLAGTAQRHQQDEAQSSYFAAPRDEDSQIDWSQDAVSIRNLVRGLNLRPGAWTLVAGQRWRVLAATICKTASSDDPGTLLEISPSGWRVATHTQDLWLQDLYPEDSAFSGGASPLVLDPTISPGLILGEPTVSKALKS